MSSSSSGLVERLLLRRSNRNEFDEGEGRGGSVHGSSSSSNKGKNGARGSSSLKIPRTVEDIRVEIEDLKATIQSSTPSRGTKVSALSNRAFSSLPISTRTLRGLEEAGYTQMTDIQFQAIPHALADRDILGAAKTGSGKTLAFIIPVIEKLYRLQWSMWDGLGALILTPTRELAVQIFNELSKVGRFHNLSAGLVIGGKSITEEKEKIARMNILICTPGRLLQHMDETFGFSCDNLQTLVLDEADRCLDLGFSKSLNAIVENLPINRQTLLFSATQTRSVKDLARLSLKYAEYVSVDEEAKFTTPDSLDQRFITCPIETKVDILFSFLKTHLKQKSIVFFSTCKQVRFMFEIFRRLRPGIPLLELSGKMKQLKRTTIYEEFCRKKNACLFATDIAARGLDFPDVHWVVQYDCPDDIPSYIHRVGRTARYINNGQALLMLVPEEMIMVHRLREKKIPIRSITMNPDRIFSIANRVQSIAIEEPEIKELAQKAVSAYVRRVFLLPDKELFDVSRIDVDALANSYGLAITPEIRFLKKGSKKLSEKNLRKQISAFEADPESASKALLEDMHSSSTGISRSLSSSSSSSSAAIKQKDPVLHHDGQSDSEDDFLVPKSSAGETKSSVQVDSDDEEVLRYRNLISGKVLAPSNKKAKKKVGVKASGTHVVFNEEGEGVTPFEALSSSTMSSDMIAAKKQRHIEELRHRVKESDAVDKLEQKKRLREKRLKKKLKGKEDRDDREEGVQLGGASDSDDESLSWEQSDVSSISDSNSSSSHDAVVIPDGRLRASNRRRAYEESDEEASSLSLSSRFPAKRRKSSKAVSSSKKSAAPAASLSLDDLERAALARL